VKRPAFQFYPADWRKDLELQSCSIAARGLWHEMMCVMHEAEPYGHLVLNGKPMSELQAATACRVTPRDYRALLAELKAAGVPGETDDGSFYSRRMVKDEQLRVMRAGFGRLGGNPALVGAKDKQNPRGKVKPKPTPSSSSSSSEKNKGAFAPPDWVPQDAWNAWLEVRRKKRAPNTDEALRLSVVDLERFKAAGHDPRLVLEQAVKRGWQGLFEPKVEASTALSEQAKVIEIGDCPCGAPATMKVGGKPRCAAHVREDFSAAAKAA
jgi:hypothetical protein